MNTGLSDIFNENSVEKLLKNDSSPQTTNLARINTGIAEMLFGRTETPKGIGTHTASIQQMYFVWKNRNPKGDWNNSTSLHSIYNFIVWKNRNPKGDWNNYSIFYHIAFLCLEEQKPQRGLEHSPHCLRIS